MTKAVGLLLTYTDRRTPSLIHNVPNVRTNKRGRVQTQCGRTVPLDICLIAKPWQSVNCPKCIQALQAPEKT